MKKKFYLTVLSVTAMAVISFSIYQSEKSETSIVHRTPTQVGEQAAVPVLAAPIMEVVNDCSGIKAKPFSSYKKFYFKVDGKAYGLKNGREVSIKIEDDMKVLNEDGSLNYVETLTAFKIRNGISEAVCNPDANQANTPVAPGENSKPNTPVQGQTPAKNGACNVRSESDSVVLAMSWQPAFCEGKGDKPECKLAQFLSEDSYQAKNFTLHGLWPNKNACGKNYGFCGEVIGQKNFCEYPEVVIEEHSIEKELETVMPSRKAGSCLDRHEWHKHGTCQSLDASSYFNRAVKLLKNFNESKAVELVRSHIKKSKLKKTELMKALDTSFGEGASKNFIIVCKGNMLTEIQVTLTPKSVDPSTVEADVTIKSMLDTSTKGYVRGCKEDIIIDQIGPG